MGVIDRLACKLRGHTWDEHSDPVGTVTLCSRCGAMRHVPPAQRVPEFRNYDKPEGGGPR
jgi:Prophage protein (DUF1660)